MKPKQDLKNVTGDEFGKDISIVCPRPNKFLTRNELHEPCGMNKNGGPQRMLRGENVSYFAV